MNEPSVVACEKCGTVLEESQSLPPEQREPCPNCGSTARHFHLTVTDKVEVHGSVSLKATHEGQKKPFRKGKYGHDLFRKTGQWNEREMTVDRDDNRYRERISDPETGRTIRDVDEPLDHRGRGSAKRKPPS